MGQAAQPLHAPDPLGRGENVRGLPRRVVDAAMGEIRQAHAFVGLLAASSYTSAEAQWAEDLPNWIGGQVRAFAFFGGSQRSSSPTTPPPG